MISLTLIFCAFQGLAKDGILVGPEPPSSDWSGILMVFNGGKLSFERTINKDGRPQTVVVSPNLVDVVAGGIRFSFETELWQDKEIKDQLELYRELGKLSPQGEQTTQVAQLEEFAMSDSRSSVARQRELRVCRTFELKHKGNTVTISLWSPREPDATEKVISAPQSVVPYDMPSTPKSPWVQFPTRYSFFTYGSVSSEGLDFTARSLAIQILDDHLNEFMAERQKRRGAIEQAIDGLDSKSLLDKSFKDLPDTLKRRLLAAANLQETKTAGMTDVSARIADALVDRVVSKIYIEETTKEGNLVDIEVP